MLMNTVTICVMCLGVYAFGFLFMLPQLFVNYKVHISVARCIVTFDFSAVEISSPPTMESLHVQGEQCIDLIRVDRSPCRPSTRS